MSSPALLVCAGGPLLLAGCLLLPPLRGMARLLAPWAALPALLAVPLSMPGLDAGWFLLGAQLGVDHIARVMLPVTAGLWLAAGLFASRHLPRDRRGDRFYGWFLAVMSGNLLLLVALDVATFYVGFALMSVASYGLVVHEDNARARHAGRYYMVMVVIGEICVISALMLLVDRAELDFASIRAVFLERGAGNNDLVIGLLLAGFGIKAGVFGLHFWLPLAHPVAPAPASAVLSGAMIKAGLVAWLRLLPIGEMALPGWGVALAVLGLFTASYAVVVGLPQREAKTVLAYSSVSQMGLMSMVVGLGLAFPGHWGALYTALLLYMAHHGLAKGALFLGAGLVQHRLGLVAARLTALALVFLSLGIAGGPWTSGLLAKTALKQATTALPGPWNMLLPPLLNACCVLTALLLLRFLWLAWPRASARPEAGGAMLLAPWLLLIVGWIAGPALLADVQLWHKAMGLAYARDAALLVALAGLLAVAAAWLRHRHRAPGGPAVPPGDLGIPLERLGAAGLHWLAVFCALRLPREVRRLRGFGVAMADRRAGLAILAGAAETRIAAWSVTGLLVMLMAGATAWLLGG